MVPRSLRTLPGARTIAAAGIRRTLRKYRSPSAAAARAELAEVLEELRAAIAKSTTTPATLLGGFTYADVAMAQVLGFVSPPAFGLRLGKATRKNFSDEALKTEFADVIAWRDALYETHRPRPPER
jgi:glutathione S-transferase